ncbi:MAG: DUF4129 domain-containing protein [Nocardioidaceae bacterium]
MTGTQRERGVVPAWLVAVSVSAGVLILVWASASRPVALLGSGGRTIRKPVWQTPATPSHHPSIPPRTLHQLTQGMAHQHNFLWLGTLIAWAFVVAFCVGVLLVLRYLWRHRWHPPEQPAEVDFDVLPETSAAEALRSDAQAHLSAVAWGSPRNGIVRCWLRLEESISDAGMPRSPAETSAEYTVRVLHSLDLDPRAIGTLAGLYREARFSEHELDELARTTARAALQRLHSELTELRTRGSLRP